jgi:hypothetical protein
VVELPGGEWPAGCRGGEPGDVTKISWAEKMPRCPGRCVKHPKTLGLDLIRNQEKLEFDVVSSGKQGVGCLETKKDVNFSKPNGDLANNKWGIKTTNMGDLTKYDDIMEVEEATIFIKLNIGKWDLTNTKR